MALFITIGIWLINIGLFIALWRAFKQYDAVMAEIRAEIAEKDSD